MSFNPMFFSILFLLIVVAFVINLFLSRRKIPIGRISALLLIAWLGVHIALNLTQSVGFGDSINESEYTSVQYQNILFDSRTLDLSNDGLLKNGSCLVINNALSKATIILPKHINVLLSSSSLIGSVRLPGGEQLLIGQGETQIHSATGNAPTVTIIADNILGSVDFILL